MADKNTPDFEALSDEDFLNETFSEQTPIEEGFEETDDIDGNQTLEERLDAAPAPEQEEAETPDKTTTEVDPPEDAGASQAAEVAEETEEEEDQGAQTADTEETSEETTEETPEAAAGEGEGEDDHTTPNQTEQPEEPDYKALYENLMKPFKANGKEFKPESPEDLVRLAQMGANYTKKMQALKPNLKLMRMLENNGLLKEDKLNFLIDLEKKNPQAIQKLLSDGEIDPMDLDLSQGPAYTPGNHTVSDAEWNFQSTLEDVMSTQEGKETVQVIHEQWDDASKQAIFQAPDVLQVINQQRSNGIYATITAEIERQQMLGNIPHTMPFIEAYRHVGDQLYNRAPASQPAIPSTPAPNPAPAQPQRQVVETRVAAPRKPAANGDKARAASPGPTSAKAKPREFDPFAMSDEEFERATSPTY